MPEHDAVSENSVDFIGTPGARRHAVIGESIFADQCCTRCGTVLSPRGGGHFLSGDVIEGDPLVQGARFVHSVADGAYWNADKKRVEFRPIFTPDAVRAIPPCA